MRKIKYCDLRRNWRKVRPHLDNPRVASTLEHVPPRLNRGILGGPRMRESIGIET
jgi:hypothetical protein